MENEKTKKMENAAAASRAEQNTAAYGAAAKDMAKTYDPKAFDILSVYILPQLSQNRTRR